MAATRFEATPAGTTLCVPDIAGDYTSSLAVYDGAEWSTPDTVDIVAGERASNSAPSVDAGDDKAEDGGTADCEESGYAYDCDECTSVVTELGDDATASDSDDEDEPLLIYSWEGVEGDATIADSSALSAPVTLSGA